MLYLLVCNEMNSRNSMFLFQTTEIIQEMKKRFEDDVVRISIPRTRGSRMSYTRQKTTVNCEL